MFPPGRVSASLDVNDVKLINFKRIILHCWRIETVCCVLGFLPFKQDHLKCGSGIFFVFYLGISF